MTTFDEWYAIYQADPATDGLAPTPRAAYEAGAREMGAEVERLKAEVAKLRGKPRSEKSTKPPCLCGHDDTDHDVVDGECYEVCACAGYTLNPEDSNLSHTRPMQRLREELAEAKAELEQLKAVARERNDARARVGELEATLRKCREATVDRINDAAHGCWAEPMQELIDAALAAAPLAEAKAPERVSHFECDHCGDVAIESKDGMFTDGDGGECVSCGMPGQVSMDAETAPYWNTSQEEGDRCNRKDCEDCADIPPANKRQPKLRPCPFCGGVGVPHGPNIAGQLDGTFLGKFDTKITCEDCGAETEWVTNIRKAISLWNRRTPETP